jgi:hypothetical protein
VREGRPVLVVQSASATQANLLSDVQFCHAKPTAPSYKARPELNPACTAQVKDHARQVLEKYIGKPFFDGWYAENQPRMTEKDVQRGLAWLEDRFYVIRHEDDGLPSVDWVLDLARAAVLRWGPVPDSEVQARGVPGFGSLRGVGFLRVWQLGKGSGFSGFGRG